MEKFVLNTTDFDALFDRIPEIAKITLLAGALRDAYLVIFNEDKFIPAIILGQENFVLDTEELDTINNILAASIEMMTEADIDINAIGTNTVHLLLRSAIQRFFKTKKQQALHKHPMEDKHIRRSFANKFGTMPELMFAAWIFFLTPYLVNDIMDGATINAMATLVCIERLSFYISINRRAILGAGIKDFKAKYSKFLSAYEAGQIDLGADEETLIRDIQEIVGIPYVDEKTAQKLLKKFHSESKKHIEIDFSTK